MKIKTAKSLIPQKQLKRAVQAAEQAAAHKVAPSDLDEYERIVYGAVRAADDIDNLETPLQTALTRAAHQYLSDALDREWPELEEYGLDRDEWYELYTTAINAHIETYVPDLIAELDQGVQKINMARALKIAVTETTLINTVCELYMSAIFNGLMAGEFEDA